MKPLSISKTIGVFWMALAVTPAPAQTGRVLQGSVQQNGVNTVNGDARVTQLVYDMSHQLSIMPGPSGAAQPAEAAFQNDVAQFNANQSNGSSLAAAYAPCVQYFQQAYPHVVQQSRYYLQNNSAAYNREGAIANPLIERGNACIAQFNNGDVFSHDNGPAGSGGSATPQVPVPGFGGLPGYPQYGNPGGGRPPRQGSVAGSSPCQPFGPGGYDYCSNPAGTQPAGCTCPKNQASAPPSRNNNPNGHPIGDASQYLQGLARGLGNCLQGALQGSFDLLGAAAQILSGDYKGAANTLGLQPGQSVVLRAIYQELTTKSIGVSPYQAGVIAGQRLCSYGLIPGAAQAAGELPGMLRAGGNVRNPLRGTAIFDTPARQLAGKFVKTPWGTTQLGKLVGEGGSGSVYKLPEAPGKVIKIGNGTADSGPSFGRQVEGYRAIRNSGSGIQTPTIYDPSAGAAGMPPMLVLDDIFTKWPGAKIVPDLARLTAQQAAAMEKLYNQLAQLGFVWGDGHTSNIFFYQGPEGLSAGMVETDGLVNGATWQEFRAGDPTQTMKIAGILQRSGLGSALFSNYSPQSVMQALFQARTR